MSATPIPDRLKHVFEYFKISDYERQNVIQHNEQAFTDDNEQVSGSGYLYVIKCNEYFKIGIAANPRKRLQELQIANPYELELVKMINSDDPRFTESSLHGKYCEFRIRGEWFKLPEQAVTELVNMVSVNSIQNDNQL